jgi:CheY-like chemotaxis protein
MPRLLLVDDNPSIHKIAESLLAGTEVQLVCVDSGARAMELVRQGERFDVALVDTSMVGMDGWELLRQLRAHPAMASVPVAMMAGVLDLVDSDRVDAAPIQGFLKKPVELRDLADRVMNLAATSVVPPPVPFGTLPALPVHPFPDPDAPPPPLPESDVLLLTADDLALPEPETLSMGAEELELEELDLSAVAVAEPPPPLPDFVLPELDLGALTGTEPLLTTLDPAPAELDLAPQGAPTPIEALPELDWDSMNSLEEPIPPRVEPPPPEVQAAAPEALDLDLELDASSWPEAEVTPGTLAPVTDELTQGGVDLSPTFDFPDLGPSPDEALHLPEPGIPVDWSDESDSLLSEIEPLPPLEPVGFEDLPSTELEGTPPALELEVGAALLAGEMAAAAAERELAASAEPAPAAEAMALEPVGVAPSLAAPVDPRALVQAILADPALTEQLARELARHLPERVLLDLAWEVMPDLAERIRP